MTTPAIALPEPLPRRVAATLLLLLGTVVVAVNPPTPAAFGPDRHLPAPAVGSAFDLPAHFVANSGEVAPGVAYYSRGAQVPASFDSHGAKFAIEDGARRWGVRLAFRGDARASEPVGRRVVPNVIDYIDEGPGETRSVARILYDGVWPGIDARFDAQPNRGIEYSFELAAGADPERIRLAYRGATSIALDERGRLHASTPIGELVDEAPIAWQNIGGQRVGVDVDYRLLGDVAFTFQLGPHDPSRPLIIDPAVFAYSGYLGGDDDDAINEIAVDGQGNAYVAGETTSSDTTFPVKVGPDTTKNATFDGFVAKVNPAGTELVYAGYFEIFADNTAYSVDVDGAGSAYVSGWGGNGFAAKVKPDGTGLDYFVTLAAASGDAIAVDGSGNAYVTGVTGGGITTVGGPDDTFNGGNDDAFVTKLDPSGTIVYSGYIGGDGGFEAGNDIAVDAAGAAYVVGQTDSEEGTFPDTVGPDTSFNGQFDAFVAKVAPDGSHLEYAGFIGGEFVENGRGIDVDSSGAVYVAGTTGSEPDTFPAKGAPDLTNDGNGDAFFAKVTPDGTDIVYAGYLGGDSIDDGLSITVMADGSPVVGGETYTSSGGFPLTGGADMTREGLSDAFVVRLTPDGGSYAMATYVGGEASSGNFTFGFEQARGVAVDASGAIYVGGVTDSDKKFPLVTGPDLTYNGGEDGFVAKIVEQPCTLTGTSGPDTLEGTSGDDIICGEGGDDTLKGGDGNDILIGGDGNDQFFGESGDDTIDGGSGVDSISFADVAGPVDVNLANAKSTGAGTDALAVENVTGSPGADTIEGNTAANVLVGKGGDDHIFGREGDDQIKGGKGNDKEVGDDATQGDFGHDTLKGNAGKDVLHGSVGKDLVIGGPDKDKLYGDEDNDTLKAKDKVKKELVNGGEGTDKCKADRKDRVKKCE